MVAVFLAHRLSSFPQPPPFSRPAAIKMTIQENKDLQVFGQDYKSLTHPTSLLIRSVCKVRTQDPENFDEEVKSLLTAWRIKGLDIIPSPTLNLMPRHQQRAECGKEDYALVYSGLASGPRRSEECKRNACMVEWRYF